MIHDALICLEGSASGRRASEAAIEIGETLRATLVGLAIIDEPDIRAREPTGIGGGSWKRQRDEALLGEAHEKARAWQEDFLARCGAAGVKARALEVAGRPAETILDEMGRHDLTVLGRDANFRFETEDDDRKTRDTVLRYAGKPLLVVPDADAAPGPAVLVAYDGSMASRRALTAFALSGLARGRPVHVAAVDDDGSVAWDMATRGCALLDERGIAAEPHNLVTPDTVGDALLGLRAKLNACLVVLGAYTRSRLARLLWGSVTQELLERSEVPLFLHY